VIGGGPIGAETAALLREAGAEVRLLVRQPSICWNGAPKRRRSLRERMRRPMLTFGPGLGPWLYSNAQMFVLLSTEQLRIARAQNALGPAGAWWLEGPCRGRYRSC